MNKSNAARYFQFFLIVLAAGAIFPVIYLKTNYQETILEVFNMQLSQLNTIYSALGMAYLIGYFPSGLLADKFSAKKLITVSLFLTGLGGLWFAQIPSYSMVVVIFVIWGLASVFAFWGAHLKIVKMLASAEEEGRFFGILDGGRGVVEALLASAALAIFSATVTINSDLMVKREALVSVIYMYSFTVIAVAILIAIFVKEDKAKAKTTVTKEEDKMKLSDLKEVFQNKFVFVMGAIIAMAYTVYWAVYYVGGFLQTNLGVDPVTVSKIMVIVLWMRPIGGIGGGFLADKFGRAKTLSGAILLSVASLLGIALLPTTTSVTVFYALVVVCGIGLYGIRGTYWSLLGDCNISDKVMGTGIGCISFIGYLPDILLPMASTFLFATFGGTGGYNAYFIFTSVIGVLGVIIIAAFVAAKKKQNTLTNVELNA